jgi:hypothetical protein
MQLMPETAAAFGVRNRFDAAENIRGGAAYLAFLLERFDGDLRLVVAAYNAGHGRIGRAGLRYRQPGDGQLCPASCAFVPPISEGLEEMKSIVLFLALGVLAAETVPGSEQEDPDGSSTSGSRGAAVRDSHPRFRACEFIGAG